MLYLNLKKCINVMNTYIYIKYLKKVDQGTIKCKIILNDLFWLSNTIM